MSAASAGISPDILMMGADHVSIFATEDALIDLVPHMRRTGFDPGDFIDAFSWDYRINNGAGMIAIPCGRSTPILYVNMDIFNSMGLSPPTTWDEWRTIAEAMVIRQGAEVTRFGLALPSNDTWYWFMVVAQAGGQFVNSERTGLGCVEDGTAVEAFTFLQDLHKSGAMFYGSGSAGIQLFREGRTAMLITSVASLGGISTTVDFNWNVVHVPRGRVQVVPTGGNAVAIMDASSVQEEAWSYLDWFLKDPNGVLSYIIGSGYLPITQSMANSDTMRNEWNRVPQKRIAFDQLQFANDRGHRIPEVGDITNPLLDLAQAVMHDNADVRTQIDVLARNVADILRQR